MLIPHSSVNVGEKLTLTTRNREVAAGQKADMHFNFKYINVAVIRASVFKSKVITDHVIHNT